jgi:septal ring-binding cell division protein DamX
MLNKNMIIILGFSILFVYALGIVRIFKREGFENSEDEDIKENMKEIDSDNESDNDSDNDYMQDKDVIKKIKKMNPKILKSLNKLNSIDIKEINTYINTLKDVIDA